MEDAEYRTAKKAAAAKHLTLADYIRQIVREQARHLSVRHPEHKLSALRQALEHEFPAPDIDTMLEEIDRGYAD